IEGRFRNPHLAVFSAALLADLHQEMTLEERDILLDILQVPSGGFGQLIDRLGALLPNHAEQSEAFLGEETARGFQAGEMRAFALLEGPILVRRAVGLAKVLGHRIERANFDGKRLAHGACSKTLLTSE